MNINYNKLDNVNAEVTIVLEEKDYQDKVKAQLKQINKSRPEPGYRPGHVPAALIEKKYGKAVKYDVINKEVADALYNYIKENDLHVLGNPVPRRDEEFDLDQKEFKFTFDLGLAPEIDTHVGKEMTVPYYTIEVSDEMINRQDEAMRRRFGAQIPGEEVEKDALVKGVITELNEDGSVKEGGIVVENGIVSPQHFKDDAQRALFADRHVGDVVRFNPAATCDSNPAELSSMLNIAKEDIENHKGDFNFEIKEIIVLRPAELNQEYFDQVFGKDKVHNEEEYRAAIKDMIASQLVSDSNYRFSIDAKDTILKAVGEIELPDKVLKDYLMQQDKNITPENVEEQYAAMRQDLIWQLCREELSKKFDLKIEENDLKTVARMIARSQLAQYGITNLPEDALDGYADNMLKDRRQREYIANQTFDMKLFHDIKEAVTVDDKTVTVEQFNDLFKPAE